MLLHLCQLALESQTAQKHLGAYWSSVFLANVHNVAKFRFRTSDANDARYLTQRACLAPACLAAQTLSRPLLRARSRAAAPASQLLFGAIHVSVSHLPTNISLEMYYPDTL